MDDRKYCIYAVVNKQNGKIYIGKTGQRVGKRWRDHWNSAKCGNKPTYFTYALLKWGRENFDICVIDETYDFEDSSKLEMKYIQEYKSHDQEFGYNTTLGGEGVIATEATKTKMRDSMKKRPAPWWIMRGVPHPRMGVPMPPNVHEILHKKGRKAPNLGRPHTLETKLKISKARKLPISCEQVNLLLEQGLTWKQAAENLGVSEKVIENRRKEDKQGGRPR